MEKIFCAVEHQLIKNGKHRPCKTTLCFLLLQKSITKLKAFVCVLLKAFYMSGNIHGPSI